MVDHDGEQPPLSAFLQAPPDEVARVAPRTVVFAAGGTRRGAALADRAAQGDGYARYTQQRMAAALSLIFEHGVEHVITFAIIPSQFAERTPAYRERLIEWIDWGLAGDEALALYARQGWRVRLAGSEEVPALQPAATRLAAATPAAYTHSVWWHVVPDAEAPWRALLRAAAATGATTRAELVAALYGEVIPAATMFLSFGKPLISPALLPPPLAGELHCYWSQRPSYEMDHEQWRRILYDYAFTRATWQEDKDGRAEAALAWRAAWERGPTVGVGTRLGPFWYPGPISLPQER
jgi:hypothetical protein